MYAIVPSLTSKTNMRWKIKCKAYIIIMLQILVLYLPLSPELHFSILGILMISIFFLATWKSAIGYTELAIFGFIKDLIAGHNVGCSAIEFVILLAIGDAIRKITNDRSATTALIFFTISITIVTTLHEVMLSFIYRQIIFSIKYWQFVALCPIFLYVPMHIMLTKCMKLEDARQE